jgi:hypothetical protein
VRNLLYLLFGLFLLFAIGCSSVTVNYDYDAEADFSKYKNFAWMAPNVAVGDARAARGDNTLFYKRLRGAMDKQLAEKGYTINADDPHFVIVYHLGVEERVDVTNWGYSYGPYWGPWGSNVDVYHYQEGTLIVDFIDYETKQLIWRGTAQKALSSRPDPDRAEAIIADIVERMLRNFPPPQ